VEIAGPLARNAVTVLGNQAAPHTTVFVHGLGTDQTVWRRIAAPFLQDFRVVLLDNVGAPAAPTPRRSCSTAT
jgi:sigma-B regulation protein RsbQ